MIDDPAFADYEVSGLPDRKLREDEFDQDFVDAVEEVGQSLSSRRGGGNGKGHPATGAETETKPPRVLFETFEAAINRALNECWLIEGLIEIPSTGGIIGASGAGKSFVAIDLAANVAEGTEWAGRPVTAGPTFYIAQEGKPGVVRRGKAWRVSRGLAALPDNLFVSISRIELNESGGLEVENEVGRLAEQAGGPPVLIVVDTMARALPGEADENSAKDVGAFLNVVDRLRDAFNCVVLIVHHVGHSEAATKRARGSSVFKAALDFEILVTKKNKVHTVEWTKMKDGEEPPPQEFALEKISLGVNEAGKPVRPSAVVSWRGVSAKPTASVLMKEVEILALNTLKVTIVKKGGGETSATLDSWRAAFTPQYQSATDAAKRKAFDRARKSLKKKGLIRIVDGRFSIPIRVPEPEVEDVQK